MAEQRRPLGQEVDTDWDLRDFQAEYTATLVNLEVARWHFEASEPEKHLEGGGMASFVVPGGNKHLYEESPRDRLVLSVEILSAAGSSR